MLNLFHKNASPETHYYARPTSNVLGATGLSRGALRQLFAQNGLFGADSVLETDEQVVVQRALGRSPSVSHPSFENARSWRRSRLAILNRFTEQAVRGSGEVDATEWERAQSSGVQPEVLTEILRVVDIVRDVYGLPAKPAVLDTVRLANVEAEVALKKAA